MKINHPVTQNEIPLPPERLLVSKTDLKGQITYANEEFIAISGFSREELVGQNHNIVRHPDMPPQAFGDLWQTVRSGRPWRGIVKNRAKNGDFYWVVANVVPVSRDDRVVAYMSVRSAPTHQQIAAAEALYRRLREGGGSLPRRRGSGITSIRGRLAGCAGLAIGLLCLVGYLGYHNQDGDRQLLAPLTIGGSALLALLFALTARAITTPMHEVSRYFRRISEGILLDEVDIDRRDECGDLLASLAVMQTNLKVMVDNIQSSVRTLLQSSADLDAQMYMVTMQSQQQQNEVESVAATTEEFTQAVKEVAGSAQQTADYAERSKVLIAACNDTIGESLAANAQVVATVSESSRIIGELSDSIRKIGDVTGTIEAIADQTNLLALNAAIEAARAGEAGRGFAVVADEVRKLSETTAQSTRAISALVGDIQTIAGNAVAAMGRAVSEVDSGVARMQAGVDDLARITEASDAVNGMAQHIAAAAKQQATAGDSVAASMESVAGIVEQNSHIAQQAMQLSKNLLNTAERLKKNLAAFKIVEQSASSPREGAQFIEL